MIVHDVGANIDRMLKRLAEKDRRETAASMKRRMVDLIIRRVSASGCVTRDDLISGGFSEEEITTWYRPALKASAVHRLGVDF